MQKIKIFVVSNFFEIFFIFSLFAIFCVLMLFFGQHTGNVIVDCGREAYFPAEILKGKILYKDIFNIFGPLSYQINAVFYAILGVNLKSLYIAGFLNAGLIIFLLYFIARFFTSKEISWILTLFIIVSCIFNPYLFNYIFPYSYAMVYAFSGLLFSILFLLLYLKTSKDFFITFAWFFMGVSITSKYDYLVYAIFLAVLTIFKSPKDKKYLFLSLISFFAIPFLITNLLIFQSKSAIPSSRGTIYEFKDRVATSKKMIDYISRNLKQNDSIWIIPEGTMFNFLTNHPSNGIYYAINTPYLETFSEEKIISETIKNSPNYIIITNQKSYYYGYNTICKDYGFKICKYVNASYLPVSAFGNKFKMVLYKKIS